MSSSAWFVYIILCSDESLYTGITTDVKRRFDEHFRRTKSDFRGKAREKAGEKTGKKGAKYFLGRKPKKVVYVEDGHDRSSASRREAEIKAMSREQKLCLIDRHRDSVAQEV